MTFKDSSLTFYVTVQQTKFLVSLLVLYSLSFSHRNALIGAGRSSLKEGPPGGMPQ